MPMGVLYVVRYGQSALGSFSFHPLPISSMVLCRIFLICLLDVSAWPLVWGWYGVAMLWWTPCSARYFRKTLSMNWILHRLWPSEVYQSEEIWLRGTFYWHVLNWQLDMVLLLPISTHSPWPPKYTRNSWTWGTAPWNQSPHIKEFYLEIVHERHCISWVDVPLFLTSVASPNKFLCIFIHCWPEKATLPDLGICLECSIMSSIWWGMTSLHNLGSLIHRDTSSQQSIGANSV